MSYVFSSVAGDLLVHMCVDGKLRPTVFDAKRQPHYVFFQSDAAAKAEELGIDAHDRYQSEIIRIFNEPAELLHLLDKLPACHELTTIFIVVLPEYEWTNLEVIRRVFSILSDRGRSFTMETEVL